MPFLLTSAFLLLIAYPMIGTAAVVWVLAGSQLVLLVREIRRGQVTGAGGFILMSFLFFGVRPIYLLLENDKWLLTAIYRLRVDTAEITSAMWWASLALWCFALGAVAAPRLWRSQLLRRKSRQAASALQMVAGQTMAGALVFVQLLTLPVMLQLAARGRAFYGSSLGAYLYDLPVPLQALHILAVVVLLERYLKRRDAVNLTLLGFSCLLFLYFTWLMRDVSLFRGFYISGVMIAGIAILQRVRGRVGYAWLVIPIIALQPFFQYLGEDRTKRNEELAEEGLIEEVFEHQTLAESYWSFYDSKGDMNIFDTFIAAKQWSPAFYPYAWSWLYVPLHIIPRGLWPGKPERGITQDLRFTRGAPTCPGVAGFFLADGGLAWMLASMFVLGVVLSSLDWYVLTMPRGYLFYCMIGIITVQGMFLSRAFLWFYFWQMMYAVIPIVLISRLFQTHNRKKQRTPAYSERRTPRPESQAPAVS